MKLLSSITLTLLASTLAYSQTTMCFKENHQSMATIETTTLDGGKCSSSKSVQDMKNEGWSVDDINIESTTNGKNYIYIFKKEEASLSSMDEEKLEQRIMQRLEKRKQEESITKKRVALEKMSQSGKEIYIKRCLQCHGEKAEKIAYGTSRPLINLSLEDMQTSIRDYTLENYDRGAAFVMKPYANILNTNKVKDIYSYIKTLKPKKEESK